MHFRISKSGTLLGLFHSSSTLAPLSDVFVLAVVTPQPPNRDNVLESIEQAISPISPLFS